MVTHQPSLLSWEGGLASSVLDSILDQIYIKMYATDHKEESSAKNVIEVCLNPMSTLNVFWY